MEKWVECTDTIPATARRGPSIEAPGAAKWPRKRDISVAKKATVGARKATRPMSDDHKAALAEGREQGRAVRRYLEAVESAKPRRGRKRTPESIRRRLAAIDEQLPAADPLNRVHLVQDGSISKVSSPQGRPRSTLPVSRRGSWPQPVPTPSARASATRPGVRRESRPGCCGPPASDGGGSRRDILLVPIVLGITERATGAVTRVVGRDHSAGVRQLGGALIAVCGCLTYPAL